MSILDTFGRRASEIHAKASEFAVCARIVRDYAGDTLKGQGQAEHQLVTAIADLQASARILRQLLLQVEAERHAIETADEEPKRIPVLTYGQPA